MSFRRPPPLDTVYADWTLAPELLLAEAQRLRAQQAANRILAVVVPAVVGAAVGIGTCAAAYAGNILPSPDTSVWLIQAATGAVIGCVVALPLAARLVTGLRKHAARTFNGGLLRAALGSQIRERFPHLHGRDFDAWPRPEAETLRQRLRAIRDNYTSCAADQGAAPWPAQWTAQAVACFTLALGMMPLLRSLGSDNPAPLLAGLRHYFANHLVVAWFGFAAVCVVYCLVSTYAAVAMTTLDAALADGLERVGQRLLEGIDGAAQC